LQTPVTNELKKYCFEFGKSVYNFLQIIKIKHLIEASEGPGGAQRFRATIAEGLCI